MVQQQIKIPPSVYLHSAKTCVYVSPTWRDPIDWDALLDATVRRYFKDVGIPEGYKVSEPKRGAKGSSPYYQGDHEFWITITWPMAPEEREVAKARYIKQQETKRKRAEAAARGRATQRRRQAEKSIKALKSLKNADPVAYAELLAEAGLK